MEEQNKQTAYARWQCIFTAVAALCCLLLQSNTTAQTNFRTGIGRRAAVGAERRALSCLYAAL